MPVPFANLKQSVQAASLPVNTTALSCDGCYCRGQPYPIGKYGKTFLSAEENSTGNFPPWQREALALSSSAFMLSRKKPTPNRRHSSNDQIYSPLSGPIPGRMLGNAHGNNMDSGGMAVLRQQGNAPPSMRNRREEPAGINRAPSSSWAAPVRPGDADKKQPRRKSSGAVPLMFTN